MRAIEGPLFLCYSSIHWKICPGGKFIFRVQVRYEAPQGDGDETALNGLGVFCLGPGSNDESVVVVANGYYIGALGGAQQ